MLASSRISRRTRSPVRTMEKTKGRNFFQDSLGGILKSQLGRGSPQTQDLAKLAAALELAAIQDGNAIAKGLRIGQNVRGEKDRLLFLAQLQNQIAHFAAPDGVKAGHRLVEENHVGVIDQRLRDARSLHHPFGKPPKRDVSRLGESHSLQKLINAPPQSVSAHSEKPTCVVQQFFRRQVIVKIRILGKVTDTLVHAGVIQFLAQDSRRAGSGKDQAEEDFEGGGLPRPIGTQQTKDFARLHLEVEGIQSPLDPRLPESHAIFFCQTVDFDGKHEPNP